MEKIMKKEFLKQFLIKPMEQFAKEALKSLDTFLSRNFRKNTKDFSDQTPRDFFTEITESLKELFEESHEEFIE